MSNIKNFRWIRVHEIDKNSIYLNLKNNLGNSFSPNKSISYCSKY